MSIEYTYTIISVDENARCMDIVYSSDGRETMRVGARLPHEGENLEDVVRMYSPVPIWLDQSAAVVVPAVGTTGTIKPTDIAPITEEQSTDNVDDILLQEKIILVIRDLGLIP